MKKIISAAILVIIAAASFYFIKWKKDPSAHSNYLVFYSGNVEIKSDDSSAMKPYIKMPIFKNHQIHTGRESTACIQFGYDHIIRVYENTICRMNSLADIINPASGTTDIFLDSGAFTCVVRKLEKNGKFNILLNTLTISVRGTAFSAEKNGQTFFLFVHEGEVEIYDKDKKLEARKVSAGEGISIADIDKPEIKTANKFMDLNYQALYPLPGIECAPDEYIEKYYEHYMHHMDSKTGSGPEKTAEKKYSSLEEIKKDYKVLSKIILFNNKVVYGAVLSSDAKVRIMTTEGEVVYDKTQIRKMEVIDN
jgi:hypothetical protein